jgi:hypothetical protein
MTQCYATFRRVTIQRYAVLGLAPSNDWMLPVCRIGGVNILRYVEKS